VKSSSHQGTSGELLVFDEVDPIAPADIVADPRWTTRATLYEFGPDQLIHTVRIIQTLGHKLVRIKPIHGFAAECTGASILYVAGILGMPVSTTHAITTSIMGVGCARRFSALNYTLVERILWAWVLTIPATALIAYALMRLMSAAGWDH